MLIFGNMSLKEAETFQLNHCLQLLKTHIPFKNGEWLMISKKPRPFLIEVL